MHKFLISTAVLYGAVYVNCLSARQFVKGVYFVTIVLQSMCEIVHGLNVLICNLLYI